MRSAPVSSRTWSKPPARKNFHVWFALIVLLVDPAINVTPASPRPARRHPIPRRHECQLSIPRRDLSQLRFFDLPRRGHQGRPIAGLGILENLALVIPDHHAISIATEHIVRRDRHLA